MAMGLLSTIELIGRIGETVITRFREGAVEFFVAPDDPTTLRLSIGFAAAGDHQDDLARLIEIAIAAGIDVVRGWASQTLVAIDMAVRTQAAAAPLDRVIPFTAAGRRPRLASRG
jgi:hypothetical protein